MNMLDSPTYSVGQSHAIWWTVPLNSFIRWTVPLNKFDNPTKQVGRPTDLISWTVPLNKVDGPT